MTTDLIVKEISKSQVELIRSIAAPKCTNDEFKLLLYQAKTYGLDPLVKQIWAIKYQDGKPASIFVGRDGLLAIAHRSGAFDRMESGTKTVEGKLYGWAKVYRKDMRVPFSVEVSAKEYNRGMGTWNTHPETMIQKVAEAQALRRAFSISGIYTPEEMPESEKPPMQDITPEEETSTTNKSNRLKRLPVNVHKSPQPEIIDAEATRKDGS